MTRLMMMLMWLAVPTEPDHVWPVATAAQKCRAACEANRKRCLATCTYPSTRKGCRATCSDMSQRCKLNCAFR